MSDTQRDGGAAGDDAGVSLTPLAMSAQHLVDMLEGCADANVRAHARELASALAAAQYMQVAAPQDPLARIDAAASEIEVQLSELARAHLAGLRVSPWMMGRLMMVRDRLLGQSG